MNTKGIKQFLLDAKAISPAIATLILIVIAAVAAAGIGIIVQKAQTNTQGQVGSQDLSVSGTINIKGSTTVMPITIDEAAAFQKLDPAVTINIGGGGSGYGFAAVDNKMVDIGEASDQWTSAGTTTDPVTGQTLKYGSYATEVLQGQGADAFINELQIGTGMVVVAGNIPGVNVINVFNDSNMSLPSSTYNSTTKTLTLGFNDLRNGYINGTISVSGISSPITLVSRSDDGGTLQVFSRWIGLQTSYGDGTKISGAPTIKATPCQGNDGCRNAISGATSTNPVIGYVDVAFSDNYAASITGQSTGPLGSSAVIAASQNGTAAIKNNRGVTGTAPLGSYNAGTEYVNGGIQYGSNGPAGLARNLYYYSQPGAPAGAVKAFEDFVMSPAGQNILTKDGFYSP